MPAMPQTSLPEYNSTFEHLGAGSTEHEQCSGECCYRKSRRDSFYVCPAGLVRQGCECEHQRDVRVTHGSGELGSQRTLEGDSTRMTCPVSEISMPQQVSWNLNDEDLKSPQIAVGDF
jgi:hypothetical protein